MNREEALKYLNNKKKKLENTIAYKENLQEIEYFTRDKREEKEAREELEVINYLLKIIHPKTLMQEPYKPSGKPVSTKRRNRGGS